MSSKQSLQTIAHPPALSRPHSCAGIQLRGFSGFCAHIELQACGGLDAPVDMQWQTIPESKVKPRTSGSVAGVDVRGCVGVSVFEEDSKRRRHLN